MLLTPTTPAAGVHVGRNRDRTPDGDAVVPSAPPPLGGEVELTEGVGELAKSSPAPHHRWTDTSRVVAAALRAMLPATRTRTRPRRHYPASSYEYLERALVQREVRRL